ncbi:hypothetical protein QFZ71_003757 [Streptomyces sp. V2I9]|nr:hypothetical protein [Streptomyces sp. V2I9]
MPRATSPAVTDTTADTTGTTTAAPGPVPVPTSDSGHNSGPCPGPGPGPDTVGPLPWEELVTSALLGTDRRPPAARRGGTVPADAPAALLDAVALHTVRRRAGLRPTVPQTRPDPAPADPRPVLPEAARHRLAHLLADRDAPSAGGRRGTAPPISRS